jgi:geranylgeranyl pyrophosphate synthase
MNWLDDFNASLIQRIKSAPGASPRLREALTYAASSPGKRLRPCFVYESGTALGLIPESITPLAQAIEFTHLFSLVHDDLPALDNDDFRRGLPTVHKQFDEGTALLAGDELLNFAWQTALELRSDFAPERVLSVLEFLSECIGAQGMIGGQLLELELEKSESGPSLEELITIQKLKTGALFRASILGPAILAGVPREARSFVDLEKFADAFGFACQIADDLEDEKQDEARSKKNILSLMGREAAIRLAQDGLLSHPVSQKFTPATLLIAKLSSK